MDIAAWISGFIAAFFVGALFYALDKKYESLILWSIVGITVFVEITVACLMQQKLWDSEVAVTAKADPLRAAQLANIKILRFFTSYIQYNPNGPLDGWAIQVIFKNYGNTDARGVKIGYGNKVIFGPVPAILDLSGIHSVAAPVADIAGQMEFQTGAQKIPIGIFNKISAGTATLLLFGEVTYFDITSSTAMHTYEFCASVVPRGDSTVISEMPFSFKACPFHNSSR